jgi:hypothetical protein
MLEATHEGEDKSRTDTSALSSSTEHDHGSEGSELTLRDDKALVVNDWLDNRSYIPGR